MAEYLVPVNEGKEKVRVTLDSVPQGDEERERMIDEQLAKGAYQSATPAAYRGPGGSYIKAAAQAGPAIVGGLIGAAGGSFLGPAGTVAGEALGSAAGEALTQYADPFNTGIEQPNPWMVAGAGALPPVARGAGWVVGKVVAPLANRMPSIAAGRQAVMQAELGEGAKNALRPFEPSAPLFQQVERSSQPVMVGTSRLATLAGELDAAAKVDVIAGPKVAKIAGWMNKLSVGGYIPLAEFRQNMRSLGAEIGRLEASKRGGAALIPAKRAYAAMADEMEDAVTRAASGGNPVGATLAKANDSYKRELAEEKIGQYYERAVSYNSGRRQVDINKVLSSVDKDRELLEKWMGKDGVQEFMDILKDYGKRVPKIPSNTPSKDPFALSLDFTANAFDVIGAPTYGKLAASQGGRRALRVAAESGKAGGIALLRYAAQTGLVSPDEAEALGGPTLNSLGFNPPPSPAFRSELRNQLPPAPLPGQDVRMPRSTLPGGPDLNALLQQLKGGQPPASNPPLQSNAQQNRLALTQARPGGYQVQPPPGGRNFAQPPPTGGIPGLSNVPPQPSGLPLGNTREPYQDMAARRRRGR